MQDHALDIYQAIRPLTEGERITAHDLACDRVIARQGVKPHRDHFKHTQQSKYPQWLIMGVLALSALMLLAAFVPSAIRLYDIGSRTFGSAIPDETSKQIVGLCVILLAETGAILFTLAFAVLDVNRITRAILGGAIILTAAIALVGNYQVALYGHEATLFTWLEALAPPILTLATAYILKEVALHSIASRHADNMAYQGALEEYQDATRNPENSPLFQASYANALRETIQQVNGKGRGRNERLAIMATLNSDHWRALVARELQADAWHTDIETATMPEVRTIAPVNFTQPAAPELAIAAPTGNGNQAS